MKRNWECRNAALAAVFLIGLLPATAEPSVKIDSSAGYPQVVTGESVTACDTTGLTGNTRQAILNAAALEWSAFEFPRYSLTRQRNYAIVPPGISAKQSETSSNGPAPRLLAVGAMEDDASVRERIGRYWASLGAESAEVFKSQNAIWKFSAGRAGWAQYWSAAFVSYVMCKAGLSNDQFPRSSAHKDYIAAAIAKSEGTRPAVAFSALDIGNALPKPGDVICAAREDASRSINSIADFKAKANHGAYHCDIVVGFDVEGPTPGVLYAIGGNVLNAVTLTETPVGRGRVMPVKAPHARNWFVILSYVGPDGPASFRKTPDQVISSARRIRDARQAKQ